MNSSSDTSKKGKTSKGKSNEEVLAGFQKLRNEQRHLSIKINELELDLHEHRIVIDTLKDLDGNRKCFRMVGGVLCERTVKEVLPILKGNEENFVRVIDTLNKQIVAKGTEINKYIEENNLKIKNVDELDEVKENENKVNSGGDSGKGSAGVLVS